MQLAGRSRKAASRDKRAEQRQSPSIHDTEDAAMTVQRRERDSSELNSPGIAHTRLKAMRGRRGVIGDSLHGVGVRLGVAYGGIWGENYWYAKTKVWEDQRLLSFVPREIVDERSRRPFTAPDEEYNHIQNAKQAKKLADAGVGVQLGAHGQREGLAAHWEVWMFAQGGMTPLEALRSGTLRGAEYLGMESEIGSLAPGKLADFILLSKNPLDDIRNTTAIDRVVANGRVYDGSTLDEEGERSRKRPPFFWQVPGRGTVGATTGATDQD